MGKVSIIIPVYNTEKYAEECINSVIKQTHKNIEIILINDGSNMVCTTQLDTLKKRDNRIKLYQLPKRRGVGFARNFGVQQATGDYIYFLDSDDYIPPETIELLVGNIGKHQIIKGKIKTTDLSSGFTITFRGLFKPKVYTAKRFDLTKNNSVLNTLFNREFIVTQNIKFASNLQCFSDLDFLFPAFEKCDCVLYLEEAIYFHRKRNDPISDPSLSQLSPQQRIEDFLLAYTDLKFNLIEEEAHHGLDRNLLNFYRKEIISYFYDNDAINAIFPVLYKAIILMDKQILDSYDRILKKEIKTIVSGNMHKFKNVMKRHHLFRDIRIRLRKDRKLFLYRRIFMKLPLKKKLVFFESFLGKSYSDNPKYIYEYIQENYPEYKCVWSFREKKNIPGNAIQVKRFSLRYFYYLARAKYWISNSRLPKYLEKREGNIYLQTWHGTPLKKLVFDMDEIHSADPKYKENFYYQSRRWDFLNSPNEYSSIIFRRAFKYDKELLEFGYPRNDVLYQKNNREDILDLKRKINLPTNKKIILYAPTWRDDDYFAKGKYNFELQLNLQKMQERLGDEYIILLRMHYFIANDIDLSAWEGFAFNFSHYEDIAELYLVSDMLITDYSSVFFDYSNLKRPILFYTYDLEKYRDELRGFYLDINKDLPGPLLMNTDEVIYSIENIDKISNEYKTKYEEFYEQFCQWDDGNATEKTVKALFEHTNYKPKRMENGYKSIS